jgi:hypothetical protein
LPASTTSPLYAGFFFTLARHLMKHRHRLWWKRVGHYLASILKVLRQFAGIIRLVTYIGELVQDLLNLLP